MQSKNVQKIPPSRIQAVRLAQSHRECKPIFLDTETTGLHNKAEIIEIAIIDFDGKPLIQSLVKPVQSNPDATAHIHRISHQELAGAKPWPLVWNEVRGILFRQHVGIYNAAFDLKMIDQTNRIYQIPTPIINAFDIMNLFAQFRGIWSEKFISYKLAKQEDAARYCGIQTNSLHRAFNDALLTRKIFLFIANQELL